MIDFDIKGDKTNIKADYDFELYQEIKKVNDALFDMENDEWGIGTDYVKELVKHISAMNHDVSHIIPKLRDLSTHKKYQHEEIVEPIKTVRIKIMKDNPKSLVVGFDYDPKVLELIKQVEGRAYVPTSKSWRIPKGNEDWLYSKLEDLGYIELSQLKPYTSYNTDEYNIVVSKEDFPYITITPKEFQIDTVNKLLNYKKVINALEAGLGKTPITVMACEYINKPTLVVCTASIKYNWQNEIYKINPHADVIVLDGSSEFRMADYVILNYDIMDRFIDDIHQANFDIVVFDEAHKLRGVKGNGEPSSQRAKLGKEIAEGKEYVFPITATPYINQTKDIFNLLSVIEHPSTQNWYRFAQTYCGAEKTGFGTTYNGSSNQEQLNSRLYPNYMIRLRTEDHIDLPDRMRSFIPVEVNMKKYQAAVDKYMNERSTLEDNGKHLVYLTALRKELASAKVKESISMIKDLLEQNKSVVVFTNYTDVVDTLHKKFEKNAVKITGDVTAKDRQKAVDQFQNGEKKVFIGNIEAASEGITLTNSHHMIVIDFHWSPVIMVSQMEKRIHRMTQNQPCIIQYLYVPEAKIEQIQLGMLEEKLNDSTMIIDGKKEDFFTNRIINSL